MTVSWTRPCVSSSTRAPSAFSSRLMAASFYVAAGAGSFFFTHSASFWSLSMLSPAFER